ncbi:hypothetical protein A2U01_0074407, partial [Trifolium medium]|nr:hypothetical protein [Trifolium medium]
MYSRQARQSLPVATSRQKSWNFLDLCRWISPGE